MGDNAISVDQNDTCVNQQYTVPSDILSDGLSAVHQESDNDVKSRRPTQTIETEKCLKLNKLSESEVNTSENTDVIVIESSLGQLDLHVYKKRWLILIMYSLSTSLQAAVWNQWGPIAAVSEQVYGWSDGDIAMFANWGPIMYIFTALPWSWLVDTKGLRLTTVGATGLIAIGSGLRCLVRSPPAFTWLVHVCHILNGCSGPVAMGAVAKVSAVWFPPQERATATAISYAMAVMGFSLTFLIGPVVVPEVEVDMNCSHTNSPVGGVQHRDNITLPCEAFAVSAALFLSMVIYFPKQPPKPPSPSASTSRLNYISGLKQLLRKGRFWQIGLAYGVSTGVRDSWSSMLDVNLKSHAISQSKAGWIGFYGTLGAAAAGVIAGRIADRFQKRLRILLITLNIITITSYLWLVLQIMGLIPEFEASMYIAYIAACVFGFVVSPLFYEFVCETAYPVSEGITNICLSFLNNVVILVFLGILSIPNIGTEWTNWLLVSSFALAIIVLLILPDGHNRLDIDRKGDAVSKEQNRDPLS